MFACEVLHAAAPLVRVLHGIAHEWSVPKQRKGRPIDAAVARAALCDFEGSPCPLFARPRALLAALAAQMAASPQARSGLRFDAVGTSVAIERLSAVLIAAGAKRSSEQPDVLLLPPGAEPPPNAKPLLVLVLSEADAPAPQWHADLSKLVSHLSAGYDNASTFLFPSTSSAAVVDSGSRSRRKVRVNPPAVHASAVVWRSSGCTTPLYDLTRPVGEVIAAEAASARRAVASGVPFSEWFACGTLEALRPVARNLFRLPRRKGKSVWHTCMRPGSPCFWFTGEHSRGEHFVTQVLSSPDILLARLSAHRAATLAAATPESATARWPPLMVLDPAAGEANYTQHLPDGMGRMPPWQLVEHLGWHALLGEPTPETFQWLERNFGRHVAAGRVTLMRDGVTHGAAPVVAPLYWLDARVPELENVFDRGLPSVTRQRLQWGSSTQRLTALSVRGDLWLFNHLAGGPILEALEVNGHAASATAFRACKHGSATRRARCYNASVAAVNVTLQPWSAVVSHLPTQRGAPAHIDLLIVNQRDPTVGELLKAFPFDLIKPTLIYYRTSSGSGVRKLLLDRGYQTSAHWETSAWGENTIAWRADRCSSEGMPGVPMWSRVAAMLPPSEREVLPVAAKPRPKRRSRRGAG